jgi:hypothetical protein
MSKVRNSTVVLEMTWQISRRRMGEGFAAKTIYNINNKITN